MSQELERRGTYVGTASYFERINQICALAGPTNGRPAHTYYDAMQAQCHRICAVFEEVYGDLQQHASMLRFLPDDERSQLVELISGLSSVNSLIHADTGRGNDCILLLTLSDYDTRGKSYASNSELEYAVEVMLEGGNASSLRRDPMDIIRDAVDWGEDSAADGDEEQKSYINSVSQGQGRDFLADVLQRYSYRVNGGELIGRCGKAIGSAEYLEYIEGYALPDDIVSRCRDKAYGRFIADALSEAAKIIENDLGHGIWANDYIKDQNAALLQSAVDSLERCGLRCYSLRDKIKRLAWYVGGDADKIRQLQRMLGELGIEGSNGRLKEDGVYGTETRSAWQSFFSTLTHGSVPTLTWVNPLQSGMTRIKAMPIDVPGQGSTFSLRDLSARSINPKGTTIFRVDAPESGSIHVNTLRGSDLRDGNYGASSQQLSTLNKFNHKEISPQAYAVLKNFNKVVKVVRVVGKVLLVTGIVLDTLELGMAIEADLKDADEKLGRKTVETVASIGGRWGGAIGGTKLGAMGGSAIGTAIMPGIGTAVGGFFGGLILGVAGAVGGSAFAEWIVDITYVGE